MLILVRKTETSIAGEDSRHRTVYLRKPMRRATARHPFLCKVSPFAWELKLHFPAAVWESRSQSSHPRRHRLQGSLARSCRHSHLSCIHMALNIKRPYWARKAFWGLKRTPVDRIPGYWQQWLTETLKASAQQEPGHVPQTSHLCVTYESWEHGTDG